MDPRPYRIEPAKAKQAIEAGTVLVVDVTSPLLGGAVRGRIPGALWVSPRQVLDRNRPASAILSAIGAELVREKTIITYCTCPDDEASTRLSRVLRQEGYDAWVLDGGLPAWRAAGYPMEANLVAA